MSPVVVLSIAGSDSGGGAGVQADLKTCSALGAFGACALTAVTAQSTRGVTGVLQVPADFVVAQVEAVLADLPVAAVKTGMLGSADVVRAVTALAAEGRLPQLVVDPVMLASSGARLLDGGAERAYLDLLRYATVFTPNLLEAQSLLGAPIGTLAEQHAAAAALGALGPSVVVVKGGHAVAGTGGQAVDVVWRSGRTYELRGPRTETRNDHGTGCTFAAAVAVHLAHDRDVEQSLDAAKGFVAQALRGSVDWQIGSGHGPLDHFGWTAAQER